MLHSVLRFIATEMTGETAKHMRRSFQTRGFFKDLHGLIATHCKDSGAMLRWGFAILLSLCTSAKRTEELKKEYAELMQPVVKAEGGMIRMEDLVLPTKANKRPRSPANRRRKKRQDGPLTIDVDADKQTAEANDRAIRALLDVEPLTPRSVYKASSSRSLLNRSLSRASMHRASSRSQLNPSSTLQPSSRRLPSESASPKRAPWGAGSGVQPGGKSGAQLTPIKKARRKSTNDARRSRNHKHARRTGSRAVTQRPSTSPSRRRGRNKPLQVTAPASPEPEKTFMQALHPAPKLNGSGVGFTSSQSPLPTVRARHDVYNPADDSLLTWVKELPMDDDLSFYTDMAPGTAAEPSLKHSDGLAISESHEAGVDTSASRNENAPDSAPALDLPKDFTVARVSPIPARDNHSQAVKPPAAGSGASAVRYQAADRLVRSASQPHYVVQSPFATEEVVDAYVQSQDPAAMPSDMRSFLGQSGHDTSVPAAATPFAFENQPLNAYVRNRGHPSGQRRAVTPGPRPTRRQRRRPGHLAHFESSLIQALRNYSRGPRPRSNPRAEPFRIDLDWGSSAHQRRSLPQRKPPEPLGTLFTTVRLGAMFLRWPSTHFYYRHSELTHTQPTWTEMSTRWGRPTPAKPLHPMQSGASTKVQERVHTASSCCSPRRWLTCKLSHLEVASTMITVALSRLRHMSTLRMGRLPWMLCSRNHP